MANKHYQHVAIYSILSAKRAQNQANCSQNIYMPVNGHFQMNVGWPTAPWS